MPRAPSASLCFLSILSRSNLTRSLRGNRITRTRAGISCVFRRPALGLLLTSSSTLWQPRCSVAELNVKVTIETDFNSLLQLFETVRLSSHDGSGQTSSTYAPPNLVGSLGGGRRRSLGGFRGVFLLSLGSRAIQTIVYL